jgi:hypothetical protein
MYLAMARCGNKLIVYYYYYKHTNLAQALSNCFLMTSASSVCATSIRNIGNVGTQEYFVIDQHR